MSSGFNFDLKIASLMASAPSLSALRFFKDPLYVPIGVLKAAVKTYVI